MNNRLDIRLRSKNQFLIQRLNHIWKNPVYVVLKNICIQNIKYRVIRGALSRPIIQIITF